MIELVIVNYRTPGDLNDALDSLACFTPTVEHVVTVVNVAPLDADLAMAEKWCEGRPGWSHFEMSNFGYAGACNVAGGTSSASVLGFFNADVMFQYGVVDACYEALTSNPGWGVLGPRQIDQDGAITHAGIFGSHERPELRGWKRRTTDFQDVRDDAISVSGSAYFVQKACWDELTRCSTYRSIAPDAMGAFLPTKHYYEETWCSYHAHAHGWKVVYWGVHTMIHKWHRASPVGGAADRLMPQSQAMFRSACDAHGIAHD